MNEVSMTKIIFKKTKTSENKRGKQTRSCQVDGHSKGYINPCFVAVEKFKLGFKFGSNICVSGSCVPDNTYVTSDSMEGVYKVS